MIDRLLDIVKEKYALSELDINEFSSLKAGGMKFSIRAYNAEGLGHVSVMSAKGLFGLVRMDTLIVVPKEKDLPLYSYDRIYAMGNDTLIVELYDTCIKKPDLSDLDVVKSKYSYLAERDPGEHWYDDIKLSQSISKKGKSKQKVDLDTLTNEHFNVYLSALASAVSDVSKKKELSARYVNGLLLQGGPSTDVFKKSLGEEKTARLFKYALFGII